MKNIFVIVTVSMICFGLFSAQTNARETPPFETILEMSIEDLQNIDVSVASKSPRKQIQAPSSVTVFTREEILAIGLTSVEQLMNFVPGFQSTRESITGDGYVVVGRGQSSTHSSSNILFMMNGQRLDGELGGGALAFYRLIRINAGMLI